VEGSNPRNPTQRKQVELAALADPKHVVDHSGGSGAGRKGEGGEENGELHLAELLWRELLFESW